MQPPCCCCSARQRQLRPQMQERVTWQVLQRLASGQRRPGGSCWPLAALAPAASQVRHLRCYDYRIIYAWLHLKTYLTDHVCILVC